MKIRTIKLTHGWPRADTPDGEPRRYQVDQITDSTAYYPGQMLDPAEVQDLCDAKSWRVTIVARKAR